MTVSSEIDSVQYTLPGSPAPLPVTFRFLEDADLRVVYSPISGGSPYELTLNTDYSVTGARTQGGGLVTLLLSTSAGDVVAIDRGNMARTQLIDYRANDPFPEEDAEDGLDRLTMLLQQAGIDGGRRSLTLFPTDPLTAGRYDANLNRIVDLADAIDPTDAATLQQVSALISLPTGPFIQGGTGAVVRTMQDKARDIVNAKDFGVVANGITDDTANLQKAIDFCAATESELHLPPGDIILNTGLTHSTGSLYLRGSQAGTQGTRLLIKANAPAITVTAQATIENVGFIGEQDGAKTLQAGIYINNTNNVNVRDCVFSGCYDSIKLLDTCFYVDFTGLRMFDCVRAHFYGTGVTAPGYAFQVSRMMMTPGLGQYGFYLENVGSIVISDSVMSPANLTERCFRWVSNATLSGDSRFSNVVFEGSVKEALRIEGTALAPIKYAYFTNCYFNQSGVGQDAITLGYVDGISFVNSYISGTAAACTIYGDAKRVRFVNTDLPGGGSVAMFRAISGSVDGLEIISPAYTGANRLLDLSALTAPNTKRVRVSRGTIGTHATPIVGVSEGLISTDNWISYSAGAPVPGSGSFTSASVSTARYRRDGNTMHVMFEVTVTTNGTAAGSISVNLPIVTAQPSVLIGRERNAFGYAVTGTIASTIGSGIQALLKKYDDTYPGGTGAVITVAGQYEIAT